MPFGIAEGGFVMIKNKIIKYYSRKDPNIQLKVIPGHFASTHSHLNYYLDMTTMKTRQNEAERIAVAMKDYYNVMGKPIDTIVCMEGCEIIGAFLASELSKSGVLSMNAHKTIYVISPEYNSNGQLIFRDNLKHEINGRHTLLLMASATTGKTLKNSIECVEYYGGILEGISAIFSAIDSMDGHRIDALYHAEDIPDYAAYTHHDCPMCKAGEKVEALVNAYGYSEL